MEDSPTPLPSRVHENRAGTYSLICWIFFAMLCGQFAMLIGAELHDVHVLSMPFLEGLEAVSIAFLKALPVLLFIIGVYDIARFLDRCSEGEVFTQTNLKSLRTAGDTLIAASIASALIVPSLLHFIEGETGHFGWKVDDLSLGVAVLGLAIRGASSIFLQAVELQREQDEIV